MAEREDTNLVETTAMARDMSPPKPIPQPPSESPEDPEEEPLLKIIERRFLKKLSAFRERLLSRISRIRDWTGADNLFWKSFTIFGYIAVVAAGIFFCISMFDYYEQHIYESGILEGKRQSLECGDSEEAIISADTAICAKTSPE